MTEQNNTPDEINGVNNALSCYKEAVQFNASFVTSLFASFDEICGTTMNFVYQYFYHPSNTNVNCEYTTCQDSCISLSVIN